MTKEAFDQKMFEAYIAVPSKYEWYSRAFEKMEQSGGKYIWYWNSWGMIGGVWFLLYRKEMKPALTALFILLILGAFLPLGSFLIAYLVVAVLIGGYGTGEVYHTFTKHNRDIRAMFPKEQEKSIGVMSIVGGVNSVALWAGAFTLVSFLLILVGLRMASPASAALH